MQPYKVQKDVLENLFFYINVNSTIPVYVYKNQRSQVAILTI